MADLRAKSCTKWALRTLYLLNDCSYGSWDIFGEAWLAPGSDDVAGPGVWWWSGSCVAPDNPNPAKEEDQMKQAPELVGREPRGLGGWRTGGGEGIISVLKDPPPGPESVQPWVSPCPSLGLEVPFIQGEIGGSLFSPFLAVRHLQREASKTELPTSSLQAHLPAPAFLPVPVSAALQVKQASASAPRDCLLAALGWPHLPTPLAPQPLSSASSQLCSGCKNYLPKARL